MELAVADLARSVDFYEQVVGLRPTARDAGTATMGAGGAPLLRLVERPGARPKPPAAPGLFHVAILLPERRDLALVLARLAREGTLTGAADHLVSEAVYLDDPDGNGIEIYRDRPASDWPYQDGRLRMANDPLDADGLFAMLAPGQDLDAPLPSGASVGHVHLQVGDIEAARAFWIDAVGFDLTTTFPSALFMSAGGYHHHLAANVWSSRGQPPAPAGSAGLVSFEAVLPTQADVDAVEERLRVRGVPGARDGRALRAADPWGSTIVFRAEAPAG